jgi:uncharacterized protein
MPIRIRILVALCLVWSASVAAKEIVSQPTYEVVEHLGVMVPLPDGTKLATNILLPDGEGPWPTILIRTPYDKEGPTRSGHFFAGRGYAYVVQDTRGRFDSEGQFDPLMTEGKDGYEVQDWVASQPWCNGYIGTYGASYLGMTQWMPAPRKHPALKAMLPVVTSANLYESIYHNGALELATSGLWAMFLTDPPGYNASSRDVDAALRLLPLSTLDVGATGREMTFFRRWLSHPTSDAYWEPAIVDDEYEKIDIPVYNVGGWYDIFATETVSNYVGMVHNVKSQSIRRGQRLLMGPWPHSIWGARTGKIGEMDFGKHSFVSMRDQQLRWFDYTLKGIDNGIMKEPPVRIFVMGENQWRNENEWPLKRRQPTRYFLHSVKGANTRSGDGALVTVQPDSSVLDTFTYDPDNPVPTMGGAVLGIPAGPYDQREIEDRSNVLVFSTEALEAAVEVTGYVRLVLFASSDAPSTDFTAKLVDVHPTGYAQNLCDGIIRATHRESDTNPSLIEPGKIYRYEIDLGVTSSLFHAGHRIRLEVSSSNFPRFDRNPNTGHRFAQDAELSIAKQTVYHDKERPSHLILPIIPR